MFRRQPHNSSYVAYSATASRKPIQLAVAGEPVQAKIFPDVFINEYVSVKVKEVNANGDTANIKFDASSVVTTSGKTMKYDFGANVKAGSPLHQLADAARQADRPVYAALETRRRYKSKNGEVIPYTVPIHVLRGCEDGPQSPGKSNATGENCSKIVAALGWADQADQTLLSEESDSDPTQWDQVRGNQDGDLAPDGFVIPTGPNGEPVGGIIQAPAAAGTAHTADLHQKIDTLAKMVSHLQRNNGSTGGAGARPWNERLGDGSINPGSYAVTQVRHTRETAAHIIRTALTGDPREATFEQIREWESSLTRVLLWMADGAQSAVDARPDRMAKTHTEAGAWVKYVIDQEDPYTAEMIGDDEQARQAANEWAKRVRAAAGERYREAVTIAAEFMQQATGVTAQPSTPHQQEQPAAATEQQADDAPSADGSAEETDRDEHTPVTFADDQEARQLWDQLIETIGMADHLENLNPALHARFGSHMSTDIPADQMRAALAEWMASPDQFLQWAEQQWRQAHQDTPTT